MTPRSFNEPWEPEDIFDRAEAAERRARMDDIKERNAMIAAQDAAAEAERKESARLFSLRANADQIIEQYHAAGVEPVAVNDDGVPFFSLSMLLKNGWTIEEVNGIPKLIAPPKSTVKRKSRIDYDQNS